MTENPRSGLCPVTRRDFLNGMAVTVGAGLCPADLFGESLGDALRGEKGADKSSREYFLSRDIPQSDSRYYPPGLENMMRGSHPGSYEAMHLLRDHEFWSNAGQIAGTGERYDLVVVGGGISGLAAAYFFRKANGPNSKILILDNHDDFGGDAKRNEFHSGDRLLLGYGGTQSIESPGEYSPNSIGLLHELGIETQPFYRDFNQTLYSSLKLKPAVFFDRETFGVDKLLPGAAVRFVDDTEPVPAALFDQMPLAPEARRDLIRLKEQHINYLPGLSGDALRRRLVKTSYKDFLLRDAHAHPDVVKLFQQTTHDLYCVGIDAVSASSCGEIGCPGLQGLDLPPHREEKEEPYIFHFPDGNASVARLLVRSLVPGSAPGSTMEDIVTAKMDYSRLDRPGNHVRIRLNSTGVRVRNLPSPERADETEVAYCYDGKLYRVRSPYCVMACNNSVVPFLCPEMSQTQKDALAYADREPLVYTNVQIRNWTSFVQLGINAVYLPGGYFSNIDLDYPVSIGSYQFPSSPSDSCILHVLRTPCQPGLSARNQFRAGRLDLFRTPFSTFEHNVRDLLGRILGAGGFDAERDIEAITVNRWPHGYAYEYNALFEPLDRPRSERPCVVGRKPFGRIFIANSDSGGQAYTNVAIDQAFRAVTELGAAKKVGAEGALAG